MADDSEVPLLAVRRPLGDRFAHHALYVFGGAVFGAGVVYALSPEGSFPDKLPVVALLLGSGRRRPTPAERGWELGSSPCVGSSA